MAEWKDVCGYEGLYQVSDSGLVRRADTHRQVAICDQHLGRVFVGLWRDGKRKNMKVHRLVASAFIGEITHPMNVNHKNGDPKDNRVDNLEIVSHSENVRHRYYVLGQCVRNVEATNAITGDVVTYKSIRDARRDGHSYESITRSHKTGQPSKSGYIFRII